MSDKKRVILLASFGTSVLRAAEASYDKIAKDLEEATGLEVLQVFTDDDTAKAVNGIGGKHTYIVEDGVQTAIIKKYDEVIVVPVFFTEGALYAQLEHRLNNCISIKVRMTEAVMYDEQTCQETAAVLEKMLNPAPDTEYILVGQESAASSAKMYAALQQTLREKGHDNMCVLNLNDRDCFGQAVKFLKERHAKSRGANVEIVPLLIAWGDYMAAELYNSQNSLMWQLREYGYRTVFTGKGLGEFKEFRAIYPKRVAELLER